MLKKLIKLASTLDQLGFKKEVDLLYNIISMAQEDADTNEDKVLKKEPDFDKESLKKAFLEHAEGEWKIRGDEKDKIYVEYDSAKLEWREIRDDVSYYNLSYVLVYNDKKYREDTEFWPVTWGKEGEEHPWLVSIKDKKGKMYHFYSEY